MRSGSKRSGPKGERSKRSERSERSGKRSGPKQSGVRRKGLRGRRVGLFGDNKDITSESGRYAHHGADGAALVCFQCKGVAFKVNSFAFGGKLADWADVDWLTDKTHYAYTCEACGEVRFKRWPLVVWERRPALGVS